MAAIIKPLLRMMFSTIFLATGGCQAVAAILDKTGDPTEPAKYVPDHDNMLVLVEDFQNPGLIEIEAEHMNRLIAEELVAHKVAPVVNPDRLSVYHSEHQDEYRKMQIPTIGSVVGARQVLYADITEFRVDSMAGSDARKGHAEARVKVVDAITSQTRWPRDATAAGYQVVVDIPFADDSKNVSEIVVRNALSKELASRIAKLFYNAEAKEQEPTPSYPESDLQ